MRRAATLIEVLAATAIIALLAAILFPVFARARERGLAAASASNLRQIGAGLLLYIEDHSGWGPVWSDHWLHVSWGVPGAPPDEGPARWDGKVAPYLGQGPERNGVWRSPLSELPPERRSYGLNQLISMAFGELPDGRADLKSSRWRAWPASLIDRPAGTILIGESGEEGRLAPPTNFDAWKDRFQDGRVGFRREAPFRASSRPAYLMADQHLKPISQSEAYPMPLGSGSLRPWFGPAHCAAAAWMAPAEREREAHRKAARIEWSHPCPASP